MKFIQKNFRKIFISANSFISVVTSATAPAVVAIASAAGVGVGGGSDGAGEDVVAGTSPREFQESSPTRD
ncbi:MAG: hypothetical protein LBI70_02005 [Rickettsiales bacterium]|nr:hypothetical protein [Rickettsiales bacterium]